MIASLELNEKIADSTRVCSHERSRESIFAKILHFSTLIFALLSAGEQDNVRSVVKIQGATTTTRFVFVVILAITSTLVGSVVAAEGSKTARADRQTGVSSTNGADIDMKELRQLTAENSSHLEPRTRGSTNRPRYSCLGLGPVTHRKGLPHGCT